MTYEERAEESYVKYRDKKCEITRNTNNHLHKDWRKSGVDRHKAYIDGYLDGLADGIKESEKLSKMLEMACDILGDFLVYDSYSVMSDWGITLEDRRTIRSVLEKRIEEN